METITRDEQMKRRIIAQERIPWDEESDRLELSANSLRVLAKRYLRRDLEGNIIESPAQMFRRVAYHIALADKEWGGNVEATTAKFYEMLTTFRFMPNSPTFTGAGTPLGQLAACFVLPISDDMGKEPDGIFMTLRNAALIQQTGGGNGFSFSRLRPKGDIVRTSAGRATGPVGFLRVYDKAFGEIAQGGCLVPETLVFTEQGLLRLDEIVHPEIPGWQPHRLRVATDEGWRYSPHGYNNGVHRVLRVTTHEGFEIVGTPDHKVKVMTPEGPQWRPLAELQPGDAILVKLGQYRGQLQVLAHPSKRHGNQVMPEFPKYLNEDLAFFIGYLVGDGFIARGERDYRVGVSVAHDSYLVEEMPRLISRLFGAHVKVHRLQKRGDAPVTYVVDNRALKEFLLLNGLDKPASTTARVPALIRRSPKEVVAAFLRGLFEADGTVVHGYPELVTTSETLAREVQTLLVGLGIPATLARQEARGDRWGRTPRWRVRVVSHRGLEAWQAHIGWDPRSRFAACGSHEPDTDRESSYPLPAPEYWLSPVLEAITLPHVDPRGRGQGKKFRATDPALRRQLLRYVRGERRLTLAAYERLAETFPAFAEHAPTVDDLWFVHVASVEEAGERLTLDLEVEGNHTYLAWGMVTHNTRRGANMAVLRVDHPDIFEFIRAKEKEGELTNFNISVALTDEFMRAVEEDREFHLVNPRDGKVWRTVRARDLFDEIVRHAHHNGEPGALFIDTANRSNPLPHLYTLEATNPCFIGSTRIATDKGWIPIQELAERGEPFEVVTDNRAPWGGQGTLRPELGTTLRPAVKAWKTRTNARVLRLRTRMGYTVVATPDHRFLTPDRGYVELRHLKPGDKVLLQSGEGAWSRDYRLPNLEELHAVMANMALAGDWASGFVHQQRDFVAQYSNLPHEWSLELGLVIGWLVGDGWLSPTSNSPVGMVFRSPQMLARIHSILRPWFGDGHLADRGSHYQLTYGRLPYEFFTSLGVLPAKATEKRVPESIWRAPREAVIGFLQGLFSADGSVQVNETKRDCTVRLASSSRALLEDVQLLLLNFGIVSRIYKRRDAKETLMPDGRGGAKLHQTAPQYELVIGKASRDRFADLIGFADPEKHARLMAYVESLSHGHYKETFEDVVESVEDAGTADVYDLVEPETHSLIANGFVCHNCGEQWLGPYENCCLGSINLAKHVKEENGQRKVDWDLLRETVETAVHFLDNVVSANKYVPAVPQLREAALRARRIGLGIMGLADMMYDLGIRYGSKEAQEFAAQVMEFIRYHAMRKSIELAKERGPFPAIKGSIYDPEDLKWRPPQWPDWLGGGPRTDWGRPPLDWDAIVEGIKKYGIRNAAQTTVAPTGTIATVAGCEGYGCEPVFALAYIRHFKDGDRDVELEYVSPRFMRAMQEAEMDEAAKRRVINEVLRKGTCQHIKELPEHIRHTFVVAQDITAEEHVYMQAALQVFVDNSISKTINFPEHATVDDVKTAYFLAWRLGCKGITVYVTGTRKEVVLETREVKEKKQREAGQPLAVAQPTRTGVPLWQAEATLRPRPPVLQGKTYRKPTPVGTAWITVNSDETGEPFEVFLNVGKAGSDIAAISEAIGRLISLILRLPSPMSPTARLEEVIHQLSGIGGGRPLGFGPERVRSLPDAIAHVLRQHLEGTNGAQAEPHQLRLFENGQEALALEVGDICPECGQATFVPHEGCRRCTNCGYSEC